MNPAPDRSRRPGGPKPQKDITYLQQNVGKSRQHLEAALAIGQKQGRDVMMFQEPLHHTAKNRVLTRFPGYRKYAPIANPKSAQELSRVVTYIRTGLRSRQLESPVHGCRDLLLVEVEGTHFLNFYRGVTDGPDTWDVFENADWTPPPQTVIGGDFNARHETWDDENPTTVQGGDRIARWMEKRDLMLVNTPGIPTHRRTGTEPSVIDLIFTDLGRCFVDVAQRDGAFTEHFPLAGTIARTSVNPTNERPRANRFKLPPNPDRREMIKKAVATAASAIALLPENSVTADLDQRAIEIIEMLSGPLRTHGSKCTGQAPNKKPWWNKQCAAAHEYALLIRRKEGDEKPARVRFQRIMRREKRIFFRKRTEAITCDKDLFAIIGAHKNGSGLQPPPIKHGALTFTTDSGKGQALREAKLMRRPQIDDLQDPWDYPVVPRRRIPHGGPVLRDEVRARTIGVTSTSPGGDSIGMPLLQLVWDEIETLVTDLFDACLRIGHHPAPFRNGDVIMIDKKGKDPTTPAGYRPIQLLSVLGKGLERLIARRMAHQTIAHQVCNPQHVGSLPGRSAIDIAAVFTHQVETWLAEGKYVVAVMNDVKGAFDAVLHGWFIFRLRQQGWDDATIRWWESFALNRSARVIFGDSCPEYSPLEPFGLPQGSPASPIGYALSTADMHLLPGLEDRYAYADDAAHAAASTDLDEAVRRAEEMTRQQLHWCHENGVELDFGKAEAQLFYRKRPDGPVPFPTINVPDFNYSVTVAHGRDRKGDPTPATVRWLGFHLDRELRFTQHARIWARKGLFIARHIRGLAGATFGPSADLLRRTALACVLSVALWGAEVWWEGAKAPSWTQSMPYRLTEVASMSAGIPKSQPVTSAINNMMRAIVPFWKTAPIAAMHRESAVLTATQLVDRLRMNIALRISAMDESHPIRRALARPRIRATRQSMRASSVAPRTTRLMRTAALVTDPPPQPVLIPPRFTGRASTDELFEAGTKEEVAERFKVWARGVDPGHTLIYTDGSQRGDDAGWSCTLWRDGKEICWQRGHLRNANAFDGEAKGARMGLELAVDMRLDENDVTCCIDSQTVIRRLLGTPARSSQDEFVRWQDAETPRTTIRWSPGHCGIAGNERADQLASDPSTFELPPDNLDDKPTWGGAQALLRQREREAHVAWHARSEPGTYKPEIWEALGVGYNKARRTDLTLPRRVLARLLQARTGHGDFVGYHKKYGHQGFAARCGCGHDKTQEHMAHCRTVRQIGRDAWPKQLWHMDGRHQIQRFNPQETLKKILVSGEAFAALDQASGFLDGICPIYPLGCGAPPARRAEDGEDDLVSDSE